MADSDRLLFVSYNGGWISTTPLAARVEAAKRYRPRYSQG